MNGMADEVIVRNALGTAVLAGAVAVLALSVAAGLAFGAVWGFVSIAAAALAVAAVSLAQARRVVERGEG